MKIVFVSNKLTPHQIPICNKFAEEHDFLFVETMKDKATEIGWSANGENYKYVQPYTEDKKVRQEIINRIISADIVIAGSAPDSYIIERLKAGRLTYKYAERFYREKLNNKMLLKARIGAWLHHGRFQKYPLYMLCASAYTPLDCNRFDNYINRTYKWGYYPICKKYDLDNLFAQKKSDGVVSILWAGRYLNLKHPENAVECARRLKQSGYKFVMDFIGYGPIEKEIQDLITSYNLSDCIRMLGKMNPNEVRNHMEKANIFLFTSDKNEGWGAVLNESMNSACAVVASHSIGAVPYLLRHKENGLIYSSENVDSLFESVKYLLDNPSECKKYGKAAYLTITTEWNEEVAVKRIIKLSKYLNSGKDTTNLFTSGPCSRAEIIKDDWFDPK